MNLTGQTENATVLEQTFSDSGFEAAVRALAERQLSALEAKRAHGDYVSAAQYVLSNVRRGNSDAAFEWLPRMVAEPNWFALQLPVNPILDPLRSDARFDRIAASLVLR